MQKDKIRAYLELFDLPESFNEKELKEAYRDLAHVWHPDKYYKVIIKG
jgi:DnaJ-class molecular chaperone